MTDQNALFDVEGHRVPSPVVVVEEVSRDRRRTQRQRDLITAGVHPLTLTMMPRLKLHPESGTGTDDRRCGNCRYRESTLHHDYRYPKCYFPGVGMGPEDLRKHGYPRVSRGAATDCRAWWPGCTDHEWGDPRMGPDAFRSGPSSA